MRTSRDFVFAAVANERRQIATLVADLDDAQLATPSLCAGWDVKTVAAHVVSVFADSFWVFMRTALRRASMARAIDELARRRAQAPTSDIVATLRAGADHPLSPPLFGPLDPLADILVHAGDIRIPLGIPFEPDPELAALALDFLTGPWPFGFVPLGRLRGISLHGSDIDRSWGTGAEIRGPASALIMAVAGRTALLHLLDGPGLPLLRLRLSPEQ
ncbi:MULTISPECIES: maleylpyruvate isomerase family mycothiol-dependent enzyme [unclassified Mycobacterium]|uniref:maleylpyruvate isomerase family mycothiol-dependent enzyme n=1 Tax=unclassified Mycobacterium TaxID=2642494 RepID=UPI0029C8AEEC|nr:MULTISPECIES: maleylpyruvate isomerase family mycothiol-dependent enzyme [unclassified Mycobacterium]